MVAIAFGASGPGAWVAACTTPAAVYAGAFEGTVRSLGIDVTVRSSGDAAFTRTASRHASQTHRIAEPLTINSRSPQTPGLYIFLPSRRYSYIPFDGEG